MNESAQADLAAGKAAEFARTGKVSFAGRQIRSFAEIEIPAVATHLDVSANKLTSFDGFAPTMTLETLIVDNNPILSFQGFPQNQVILHFSALNTPISELTIFRSLVLLTIGSQLESINGIPVTTAERKEISGKALTEHFVRRNIVKMSSKQRNQIVLQLSECLRRGYVCDSWPIKMAVVEDATNQHENDPITVKVMRLMKILGRDEVAIDGLMEWIFAPSEPKQRMTTVQIVDERLTRQQMLINYMAEQLEELKGVNASRLEKIEEPTKAAKTKKKTEPVVSEDTRSAYDDMLEEVGGVLIANSQCVEEEENKEAQRDYKGLRKAVIRLFKTADDVSDAELAALLEEPVE